MIDRRTLGRGLDEEHADALAGKGGGLALLALLALLFVAALGEEEDEE